MNVSSVGLTVVKKVRAPFSLHWIRRCVASALSSAGYRGRAEVGIVFTEDEEMRRLNRDYRSKDVTTDVLSFGIEDDENLGDIVISLPCAISRATSFKRSVRREVADLIIHGTLHLIGCNHVKKAEAEHMFSLQDAAMRRLGLKPIEDRTHS